MNNNEILDMFYNEILTDIANNQLKVDDMSYNIHFNTAILKEGKEFFIANIHNEDVPTLVIRNIASFSNILLEFINEAILKNKWCTEEICSSPIEIKIKYFLSLIWSNMTANDFINPENYLRRCISFIKDDTFKDFSFSGNPIEILNNSHLEISNNEDKSCHSTPYFFRMAIVDDEDHYFALPDVYYAIEQVDNIKRAYIYAVQHDSKMDKMSDANMKYCKKINYLLYKTDRDIPKDELDKKNLSQDTSTWGEENIVVVSRPALVSLTATISLLHDLGVEEIRVPSYLPIHWDAKSIMYERKLAKYCREGYTEEQLATIKNNWEEEQLRIERNVTEKLIRNFRRLDFHFDGLNITAYPQDIDDFMHMKLDDDLRPNNSDHILAQISESINYEKEKGHHL